MRTITSHIVNEANDRLLIEVLDEPGSGGANHQYRITIPHSGEPAYDSPEVVRLNFQNGPIADAGVNGLTHEALLAVLIDRLQGFQRGPYANDFNGITLGHLEDAQFALQERTRERMRRGVEGTHQK